MANEPWDVPVTVAGRDKLEELSREYELAGKTHELGIVLSRLAHAVKHVGSSDGAPPFPESAQLGAKAVELLRQTEDRKELARALRVAAVPMVDVDHQALLADSLAIAREIGSKEEEAWTLYRMTRADGVQGVKIEDALAIFEEIGHKAGIATCCLSLGFEKKRLDLSEKAVALFEELADAHQVKIARTFAESVRGRALS